MCCVACHLAISGLGLCLFLSFFLACLLFTTLMPSSLVSFRQFLWYVCKLSVSFLETSCSVYSCGMSSLSILVSVPLSLSFFPPFFTTSMMLYVLSHIFDAFWELMYARMIHQTACLKNGRAEGSNPGGLSQDRPCSESPFFVCILSRRKEWNSREFGNWQKEHCTLLHLILLIHGVA